MHLGTAQLFLKILQPLSWHGNFRRCKSLSLVSKLCVLWQLEDVPGAVPDVHKKPLSMPTVLSVHFSFSRQEKSLPQDERKKNGSAKASLLLLQLWLGTRTGL